jgi:hypothetical protein
LDSGAAACINKVIDQTLPELIGFPKAPEIDESDELIGLAEEPLVGEAEDNRINDRKEGNAHNHDE